MEILKRTWSVITEAWILVAGAGALVVLWFMAGRARTHANKATQARSDVEFIEANRAGIRYADAQAKKARAKAVVHATKAQEIKRTAERKISELEDNDISVLAIVRRFNGL